VGGQDETVGVFREVCFEPDYGLEIKMVGRFIQ
jgi:hypothetical protein